MFTVISAVLLSVGIAATPLFVDNAKDEQQSVSANVEVQEIVSDKDAGELGW